MSKNMEDQIKELATAVDAFKGANDKIIALEAKVGHAPAELKEKLDKTNDAITRFETEIKELKAAVARSKQGGDEDLVKETEKKVAKALNQYLRKGTESPELKALSVDSDADGGFLVTPQMSAEIVKHIFETSPMRQYASVQSISTDSYEILQDLDEAGAEMVEELGTRNVTGTPQIKKIVISVHEMSARPLASQKILDDAAVNVESWLGEKVGDKFARKENTNFVAGNGVGMARGILNYASGDGFNLVEQMTGAASLVISPDDLIDLEFMLKGDYRKNGVFFAARQTIKAFRKFKDSQNRYLWEPGINGKMAPTLLGYEIAEMADMQANGVAGNLAVAFGDWKAAYQIVDRIGIRVIRDIYTQKPNVEFYTTKRTGGAVKNFEALKLLKVKA